MAKSVHVAMRLEESVLERVDAARARVGGEWCSVTRSAVLRALLLRGLAADEQEHGAAAPKAREEGCAL